MSQEKEKFTLSSEEKEIIWELRNRFCSYPIEEPVILMGLVQNLRRKAYRAGKLAGFERCEKMVDEMTTGLDMLNQIDAGKVFAIGTFKSLIEEEKKKL